MDLCMGDLLNVEMAYDILYFVTAPILVTGRGA